MIGSTLWLNDKDDSITLIKNMCCVSHQYFIILFPEKNEYRKSLNKNVGHLKDKEQ